MSRCKRCNVEIMDETERCPLCDSALEKSGISENMYPDVGVKRKRFALISRIYLFCAILAESILIFINLKTDSQMLWSVITGLALLYVYLLFRFAILGTSGYKIKVTVLVMIALCMCVGIDFVVGYNGWSVNYVLPAGVLVVDFVILLMMIINHHNFQFYLMWQILMVFCSLIPFALAGIKIITRPEMAWISLAVSVFLFLGTLIIGDRKSRVELRRRFHVR